MVYALAIDPSPRIERVDTIGGQLPQRSMLVRVDEYPDGSVIEQPTGIAAQQTVVMTVTVDFLPVPAYSAEVPVILPSGAVLPDARRLAQLAALALQQAHASEDAELRAAVGEAVTLDQQTLWPPRLIEQ